ncbi:conserved hypothetical protein [Cupriavidus taiwanensis]|uniref:hypothetical protein n=1 Tax=Cupriavidus taiwanensis TaxID=164546 RepID=UPI000E1A05F6|nr:hypothetical protein [Cupriavidus taiwanensis]SOZ07281.1 conserved hypothetical protein [Cupriavidus taiwanensis]
MTTIKTELAALADGIESLRAHVRDTGETTYGAVRHQAEMVLAMAEDALSPPRVPTAAMLTAGENAAANLPADTTTEAAVAAILTAALGVA